MCDNAELILGYVYGELADADRQHFETHISRCTDCRNEVAELRVTRGHLASWAPPEPDFGFRIIRGASASAPTVRRFSFAPVWGLAAAAVLVLAAAAAIASVEIRYDSNGMVVRTGWARDVAAPQNAAAPSNAVTAVSEEPAQIAALEARLAEFERAAAAREASGGTQLADGPRLTESEIIRRVREELGRSETRQQREFAMKIDQVVKEVDRARQMDYLQTRQVLGQLRGATQADVAQQLNRYWTLVSQEK
jgi:anti-sigma factor RsiW